MHSTTIRIIKKISIKHTLSEEEKLFIDKVIIEDLCDAYADGIDYNGCGCGQPSCNTCG